MHAAEPTTTEAKPATATLVATILNIFAHSSWRPAHASSVLFWCATDLPPLAGLTSHGAGDILVLMTASQIRTTTVGSYPVPDWFAAYPTEQARLDATRVIFDTQRQAGIDLPTEGEIYRFDLNHPDTNGMIDYFVGAMSGVRTQLGRTDWDAFSKLSQMRFRRKPAAVI